MPCACSACVSCSVQRRANYSDWHLQMDVGVNVSISGSFALSIATEKVTLHPKSCGTDSSTTHNLQCRRTGGWMHASYVISSIKKGKKKSSLKHIKCKLITTDELTVISITPLCCQSNTRLTWQDVFEFGGICFRFASK